MDASASQPAAGHSVAFTYHWIVAKRDVARESVISGPTCPAVLNGREPGVVPDAAGTRHAEVSGRSAFVM